MALKASNVVGNNSVTLRRIWWIFMVRRIDDLVLGTPETTYVFGPRKVNRDPGLGIQGSGVGNTLNASLALDTHYKSILLPADEEIIGSS
jgi:hypothetical protein